MKSKNKSQIHPDGYRRQTLWRALAVMIVYFVFSVLWIALSDRLLHSLFISDQRFLTFSILKGFAFVTVMALLIGGLTYVLLNRIGQLRLAIALSRRDIVTGTGNRLATMDALQRALAESRETGQDFAVMFLDVLKLKRINQSLGRSGGDRVLREVGRRICACTRARDVVARLESDKFTIVMPPQTDPTLASGMALAIGRQFETPVRLEGIDVPIQLAIGVAVGAEDATSAESLLDTAERALSCAKERGKPVTIHTNEPFSVRGDMLQMEAELRAAPRLDQLRIHLQPQYDLQTGVMLGAEALVRWQHPERGLIMPGEFIPLAEAGGFIGDLTRTVIRLTCALCAQWDSRQMPILPVSINLSSIDLISHNTMTVIADALADTGLKGGWLSAEITESGIMEDPEYAMQLLERLRALGISVAIDDFGTGYSSLGYLSRFTVDYLKVDRTFVSGVQDSERSVALLRAINDMAHAMGVHTLAEGVETEDDLKLVRGLGFDAAQGFLFGYPLPAEEFLATHYDGRRRAWKTTAVYGRALEA